MFFQINVTPKEKKVRKNVAENEREEAEQQETFELVLAPFQPQTRMKLESTVYNPVQCSLSIKNPSNRNLNVTVVKTPPKERSMVLSALELLVDAESSGELCVTWTPQEIGSWRDTLQLVDSRRTKYEVALLSTANGARKARGQARPRVLGPSNSNSTNASCVRNKRNSPPFASRESKKTANSTSLSQLSVPSKRPRLAAAAQRESNKENAAEVGWSFHATEEKTRNFLTSPEPHDFSAMINSTKFNLTPLNLAGIKFSPQKTGIISPEINAPSLRRETYTAAKYCKPSVANHERGEDEEKDENFVDSLSPQPEEKKNHEELQQEKPQKLSSDFSILINDMNLLTPVRPQPAEDFSPRGCSTGNRGKPVAGNFTPNEASPAHNSARNSTFDVSASNLGSNSFANGTYELPTSPTRSASLEPIKPTRLSRSFVLSPVMPSVVSGSESSKPRLSSSSPICFELASSRHEYSTRTSICQISQLHFDDASVKEVLEADLWAKSEIGAQSSSATLTTLTTTKVRCMSLERIDEEASTSSASFKRTKTFELPRKESASTKTRRMEISPPKKYSSSGSRSSAPIRRISPTKGTKIRKEKNSSEPVASLRKKVQMNCSIKRGQVSIPGVRIANLSLAGLTTRGGSSAAAAGKESNKSARSEKPKEVSVKLHDPDDFFSRFCNPDPFAATMTHDPFLTSTVYYDDKWMHQQEVKFKKWLNTLLTPPEHLNADVDTIVVDVGKVWQSCRTREDVALAETREAVSARYHTNVRLNTLRKAACAMFRRDEVTSALCKATVCIERGNLMIRQDRDLHRDIGLQKGILELFLSYNPLWLRIGLETVYGETIPLHSNNDLVGLTRFLITRFFSDPYIVKTHSHATSMSVKLPTFGAHMNKFILKKFILIVFFLDYAKRNKLIGHDPCLFHKRAAHKESRSILLTFSREVLSGVGDVTKVLRTYGYAVSHKQTYLDEYDYAVKDLAVDLRDGVRLCRVMELITGDRNLTSRCRVPAISRLQKVHNADVALTALLRCGYTLTGEIDAKSVADGHREKTLSLLWQIIYKFEAPRFDKAAKCVQRWWRSKLWYVRVRNFLRRRKHEAASTIQRAWRCHRARENLASLREERTRLWAEKEQAARVIQQRWTQRLRMLKERRSFLATRESVVRIQRWVRRKRETAPFVSNLRKNRRAVVTIQRHWRAEIFMRRQKTDYLEMLKASRKIQNWWRAIVAAKSETSTFAQLRGAALVVQKTWRMKKVRREFLRTKIAVSRIEIWYKNVLVSRAIRREFLEKRKASLTIEKWWRSLHVAWEARSSFLEFRKTVVQVQMRWRSNVLAKKTRLAYLASRKAATKIQATWRMIRERRNYANLRRRHAAAATLQKRWRETRVARRVRANFVEYRGAVVAIQRRYRARKIARSTRTDFLEKREAAIVIQKNWRAFRALKKFRRQKEAAVVLQTRWRSRKLGIQMKQNYVALRNAAIFVQRRFRAEKVGAETRQFYSELRSAALNMQRRFRANKLMKLEKARFSKIREAAIILQSKWRMILQIRKYRAMRKAALTIQRKWRARVAARKTRAELLRLKACALFVQRRFRANKACRIARAEYAETRAKIIRLQNLWRLKLENRMREEAAINIQTWWRAILEMRRCRSRYESVKSAAIVLQKRYRARKLGRETRLEFAHVLRSIVRIQRFWRRVARQRRHEEWLRDCKEAVLAIEIWWLRVLEKKQIREAELATLRKQSAAATKIQTIWRGHKVRTTQGEAMRKLRERVQRATKAAVPTATVAFQMQESMKMFLVCDTIGQLSMYLAALDTLTALGPKGCIAFCECNLVEKIYGTLAMSNRSLPWLEVCLRCINILITFAKLPATRNYVYRVEYIETLARLMSITVEKHTDLFLHLATLLWLLAENEHYAEAIRSCPRTCWLLTSLHTSICKKKSRLSVGFLNKSRRGEQTAPLPNPKPDWGLQQKRPRLFTTVHHAISTLIKKLKIDATA